MPMARTNFQKLEVYQLSETIADEVWGIVQQWPRFARSTIGQQLVRSADSIGANIAEGVGRGTTGDNKRFVRIARGSLYETKHWLRRACRRDLISQEQIDNLHPLVAELAPRLNAYLNSIGRFE